VFCHVQYFNIYFISSLYSCGTRWHVIRYTYNYQRFGGLHCLHLHLVYIYQSTQRHIPEDCNLGLTAWCRSVQELCRFVSCGTGFKSRPGQRLSWLGYFVIMLSLVAGFPPRRPGFKPGSGYVGFCDEQKWRWGRFSSVSPANIHSIYFSTIIFTITRGWHNRPGVAAVPIASKTKNK
jgi:hypothetical protein